MWWTKKHVNSTLSCQTPRFRAQRVRQKNPTCSGLGRPGFEQSLQSRWSPKSLRRPPRYANPNMADIPHFLLLIKTIIGAQIPKRPVRPQTTTRWIWRWNVARRVSLHREIQWNLFETTNTKTIYRKRNNTTEVYRWLDQSRNNQPQKIIDTRSWIKTFPANFSWKNWHDT